MLAGDTLTSEQLAYLEDISVGDIYIVGGTGSVSIAVENQLKKFDNELERIAKM